MRAFNLRTALAATLVLATALAAFAKAPAVGQPIPAFSMTTTDGKTLTPQSLRGRVVLIDFWATWCGPCKRAAPSMQKLHEEFSRQGLVVIGANTWERTNARGAAAAYAKEHNYNYTFTVENDKLAEAWEVKGVPTFILVDRQGNVRWMTSGFGPNSEAQMRAEIQKLLR